MQIDHDGKTAIVTGGSRGIGRAVARENAVAPGMIDTEMAAAIPEAERTRLRDGIPMGRFGSPADVAAATSFLLSDRAGWITGHVVVVDGGALVANGRSGF